MWASCWRRLSECVKDGLADCWQAGVWRRSGDSFPPFGLFEPLGLEEGKSDHTHEAVPVQPLP